MGQASPDRAVEEMHTNSRIIGVKDKQSHLTTFTLYRKVTRNRILVTDFVTAEVSKLAENSFRDVNIAFANELAMICQRLGVDVINVIKTANTHPRVYLERTFIDLVQGLEALVYQRIPIS